MEFALLEREEEQRLARRWHELGDRTATDALVTTHLKLAAKVARRYRGYGLPLADLIAEGNLGLVLAASRFEPGHGSRFSTYALWWIKAKIHEYILRSWSLVKIGTTCAQRKLFFCLRREIQKLGGGLTQINEETAELIAQNLGVSSRDVLEMDQRLAGDLSLNKPIRDGQGATEWEAMLVYDSPGGDEILAEHEETAQQTHALYTALEALDARERRVFEARRLRDTPLTLPDLAMEFAVSVERIRQIEARAFEKVSRAARGHLHAERDAISFDRKPADASLNLKTSWSRESLATASMASAA
jgi:RNA polymerase sigma-32 factor